MNWKLIIALSLLTLFMAIATVTFLPGNIEHVFWLLIFVFCAWRIAKAQHEKIFAHGFTLGLVNCFWISAAHLIWVKNYLALNPEMQSMYDAPFIENHPRLSMGIMGLLIGVISGLVLGLFSLLAKKLLKKSA